MKHDTPDKWHSFLRLTVPLFNVVRLLNLNGHPQWIFPEGTSIDITGCPKRVGEKSAAQVRKEYNL